MQLSEIQLFQSLKDKLGEAKAKELVEYIESKTEQTFNSKSENLATKQDVANVKSELTKTIYVVGLVQFLAIITSVVALVSFYIK